MSEEQHPDPIVRWKHRRTMAYAALVGGLLYPLLILVTESDSLVGLAWIFYLFAGSIVGGYVGTTVWETLKLSHTSSRNK